MSFSTVPKSHSEDPLGSQVTLNLFYENGEVELNNITEGRKWVTTFKLEQPSVKNNVGHV